MIRTLFTELIFPLLLFLFVLRPVIRFLMQGLQGGVRRRPQDFQRSAPPVPAGGELKKDPVCGTYVSTAASVTRTIGGQVVHFCSKECRDKYRVA